MTEPTSPASEQRFSDRVENYVRYRPGYPQEIIGFLSAEAGLTASTEVADIGSGTGISAEVFLKHGCHVSGVEPNREMREAAERLLAGYPRFRSIAGGAGATTLPDHSVDLIVAAQAFHWFNTPGTRAEFSRILKSGGHIALIWNERKLDSTPFLRDYEQLLLRFGTDYAAVRHDNIDQEALARFFIGPFTTQAFPMEQRFDFEGLKGRLLSSSFAPAEGHPNHAPMLAELRRLYDQYQTQDEIVIEYTTRVYVGH